MVCGRNTEGLPYNVLVPDWLESAESARSATRKPILLSDAMAERVAGIEREPGVNMGLAAMNKRILWNNIEARLEYRLSKWRNRADEMRQLAAVEARFAGRTWSDDKVFEALLMAVLSANTDWSKIERVQAELSELFSGFSLEWYAVLSDAEIGCRFPPWFTERKAGSVTLARNLVNVAATARILLDYSRTHGTADCYFTSLMHRCGGDPKLAALRLGCQGEYKLPSLGVPLAAEALKNLGFDVAKPDRHVMRAVGSFGLVHFSRWTGSSNGPVGRATPVSTSKKSLLAVMTAVQDIAEAVDERVVLVDNAIWMLCARSRLHLTNPELAEMARGSDSPEHRAEGLGGLIRSWMEEENVEEQRETIKYLVRVLDEDRLSGRKLFPEDLEGTSW